MITYPQKARKLVLKFIIFLTVRWRVRREMQIGRGKGAFKVL